MGDTFDFISNAKQQQITRRRFHKPKIRNRYLTEASFAKLTLERKGDDFGFISNMKRKTTTNHTKAISQTEKQESLAHRS
jgi:hypothetical protein